MWLFRILQLMRHLCCLIWTGKCLLALDVLVFIEIKVNNYMGVLLRNPGRDVKKIGKKN